MSASPCARWRRAAIGFIVALLLAPAAAHAWPMHETRDVALHVETDGSLLVTETRVLADTDRWCWRSVYAPRPGLPERHADLVSATLDGAPATAEMPPRPDGGTDINVRAHFASKPRRCTLTFRVHGAIVRDANGASLTWQVVTPHTINSVGVGQVTLDWVGAVDPSAVVVHARAGHHDVAATVESDQVTLAPDVLVLKGYDYELEARLPAELVSGLPVPEKVPGLHAGRFWLVALLAWYALVALVFARRRDHAPVVAEYTSPDGSSPGLLRYFWRRGFDDTCVVAGILGLAAKGALRVTEAADPDGPHLLICNAEPSTLQPEEQALYRTLFAGGTTAAFSMETSLVQGASSAFRESIQARVAGAIFSDNAMWLLPAWLLALAAAMTTVLNLLDSVAPATFVLVVLASVGEAGFNHLRQLPRRIAWLPGLVTLAVATACAVAVIRLAEPERLLLIGAVLAIQVLATHALLRLVGAAASMRKRVEGYRWYLQTAELQELCSRAGLGDLYGSLLPDALALDLAVPWSARFAAAAERGGEDAARPEWLDMARNAGPFDASRFVTRLSALGAPRP